MPSTKQNGKQRGNTARDGKLWQFKIITERELKV